MNKDYIINVGDRILITGSNGFIGSKVVETLLRYGFYNLRCFVRPSSNLNNLDRIISSFNNSNIEIFEGNLFSPDDCNRASEDVSLVIHLAAGNEKSFPGCFMNSVVTTRNLLDSIISNGSVKRLVNVSSFAVYSNMETKRGALLDENCDFESHFMERCEPYGYGKTKQDEMVMEYDKAFKVPHVIVRPGSVYGPGVRQLIPPRVGTGTFGIFLHILGPHELPLTYIDNCAEAIVLAGITKGIDGQIFNIVDDNLPTSREFLKLYKKNVRHFPSIYVPFWIFYPFCYIWEKYSQWSRGQLPPAFNRRKCSALFKGNRYSNEKLKKLTDWRPKISFNEGSKLYFEYLRTMGGN